jgi:hypothetical protein
MFIHHGLNHHDVSNTLIKGAVMSAGAQTGKTIMSKITKHPLLLVGIGIVAGYYAPSKSLIASDTKLRGVAIFAKACLGWDAQNKLSQK